MGEKFVGWVKIVKEGYGGNKRGHVWNWKIHGWAVYDYVDYVLSCAATWKLVQESS